MSSEEREVGALCAEECPELEARSEVGRERREVQQNSILVHLKWQGLEKRLEREYPT